MISAVLFISFFVFLILGCADCDLPWSCPLYVPSFIPEHHLRS